MKEASDRISVRLNDADSPGRGERFEKALGISDKTKVTKALVDAFIVYWEAHGAIPSPPFRLEGTKPEKTR